MESILKKAYDKAEPLRAKAASLPDERHESVLLVAGFIVAAPVAVWIAMHLFEVVAVAAISGVLAIGVATIFPGEVRRFVRRVVASIRAAVRTFSAHGDRISS